MNVSTRGCALACAAWLIVGTANGDHTPHAADHAPIGVMGDHFHKRGELMLSYRYMTMHMDGNRDGDDAISAATIATTEPNRFFGAPGQPPTLRVVPTRMDMRMHMLGAMYAPSDRVTLMAMVNYVALDMSHTTFQGATGTTVLGTFQTRSEGFGDTPVSALINLAHNDHGRWHATAGLSLPTGDIRQRDQILAPNGMTPSPRLPYPMQLGSGSFDPILGLTYATAPSEWSWGAQWRSVFRVMDNDEDYRLGDQHEVTGWLSFAPSEQLSLSGRLKWTERGAIDGRDPRIVAPVQTADPDRQAGSRLDAGLGLNYLWRSQRVALEFSVPVYQELDGPQLEVDYQLTLGLQLNL